ncbi:desmoplakin isoform X1, partial [Lates japonicus]
MSMYGSSSRLATMGQRSNSRPDLASPSFRNDVFVGGNGFQGDYQAGDGGYTYTTSYSRQSVHGGGPGQKVYVSKAGGQIGGGGGM